MQTQFIQKYLQVPGVREALQQLRARREEEEKAPSHVVAAAPEVTGHEPPNLVNDIPVQDNDEHDEEDGDLQASDEAVPWPSGITYFLRNEIQEGVVLKESWPAERCGCIGDCYADTCLNASSDLFCAHDNCTFSGRCSNGVYATSDVEP
ncbi:unnamed protein product [Phytophthora lilii]|uniref:Unnamed protein product n=1 Tax=Phytophthora lilii TaxID=2077276 RepID=A0A9W6UDE2_9STRA|nr:unnamed protein product [Phytophthora lilii]